MAFSTLNMSEWNLILKVKQLKWQAENFTLGLIRWLDSENSIWHYARVVHTLRKWKRDEA